MFYSQTFLARKGPLGTVWCAAHLQHRLKKSHYTATNIPKTVDLIMFPEVPLALRMSGHLLLGVVRIYSKKVDYLFRDCNMLSTWLAKAFLYTELDLPEDARQAPVESVTLPQALNLDDFNLEYDTLERGFDNHLRSEEEITLSDQIPTGIDPYVAVTFDEDVIPESEPMDVDQSTVPVSAHPGETDVEMAFEADPNSNVAQDGPPNDTEEIPDFQDSRPSNLTEVLNPKTSNVDSPGTVPEIERMRDATHDLSTPLHPPSAPEIENVGVEPTEYLDETLNEKETTTPRLDEEMLDSRGNSTFVLRSGSPGFAGLEEEPANFVHSSPQLVLQPTPPQPQQQRPPRPRKRKHFDKATVLTNKVMKERLEDPSDTRRKRNKMPSSKLGIWRLNNSSRKDQMFNESLFTGFSDDLHSVFEKDCIASKPYLAVPDETSPEHASVLSPAREAETDTNPVPSSVQSPIPDSARVLTPQRLATDADLPSTVEPSLGQQTEGIQELRVPQSTIPRSETSVADDMEMERLRDGGFPEFMQSPPPTSSPFRSDEFTPQPRTSETDTSTMLTGSYRTEPSTSTTIPEDPHGVLNSGLYDIPEMDEELTFLEISGDTPVRSPASQDSEALSGRTRALADYLKERCSSSPTSRASSEDLSLSKLLAGKTRKLAARMFFETLVLKSRNLVDVQQDEPYGDIALKLMPAIFSEAQ